MTTERLTFCRAAVYEEPWRFYSHQCRNVAKGTRQMERWDVKRPTERIFVDVPACGIHMRAKYHPRLYEGGAA